MCLCIHACEHQDMTHTVAQSSMCAARWCTIEVPSKDWYLTGHPATEDDSAQSVAACNHSLVWRMSRQIPGLEVVKAVATQSNAGGLGVHAWLAIIPGYRWLQPDSCLIPSEEAIPMHAAFSRAFRGQAGVPCGGIRSLPNNENNRSVPTQGTGGKR